MKTCPRCQQDKEPTEYYAHPTTTDKLAVQCKACRKELNAEWYANNKDKSLEYARKWKRNNPEKANAWNTRWKKEHPEQVKAWNASYYAKRKLQDTNTDSNDGIIFISEIQS